MALKKKIGVFTTIFFLVVLLIRLGRTSNLTQEVIEPPSRDTITVKENEGVILDYYDTAKTLKVRSKLDSLLKRYHKRYDFHGAVLVAKNGKIVYDNQIGYADFRKKELLHENSIFQLASVSKQFTAAAVMHLVEQNKITVQDSVTKYFPNFPFKDVKIHHLLTHSSGLPKYFWVAEHEWEGEEAPTNLEMMSQLEKSTVGRFFNAGNNFDYSNTGYFVLASIVEKVSGQDFGTFMDEKFFQPLGMKNSYVYRHQKDSIRQNQLIGYRLYKGWRHLKIRGTVNDAVVGDKNIYATTKDLYRWNYGISNGFVLSKETVALMKRKAYRRKGRIVPYGYGFRIKENNSPQVYHYGKWNGFNTALVEYPVDDTVVIVLEHTSYRAMATITKKIKNIVSENFES